MSDFYAFAGAHPFLTLCLAWIVSSAIIYPLKLVNRWIRHRNILAQGWPPAHCDADGDAVEEDGA